MSDLASSLLFLLVLVLALAGAVRFDLLPAIVLNLFKAPSPPVPPPPTELHHGAGFPDEHDEPVHSQTAHKKPGFHRSGRRG